MTEDRSGVSPESPCRFCDISAATVDCQRLAAVLHQGDQCPPQAIANYIHQREEVF